MWESADVIDGCACLCSCLQVYTQVEVFTAAISKLQELGFKVNTEESELIYRLDTAEYGLEGIGLESTVIHASAPTRMARRLRIAMSSRSAGHWSQF